VNDHGWRSNIKAIRSYHDRFAAQSHLHVQSESEQVAAEFDVTSSTANDLLTIFFSLRFGNSDAEFLQKNLPNCLAVHPGQKRTVRFSLRLPFEVGILSLHLAIAGGWPSCERVYLPFYRFATIFVQNTIPDPSGSLVIADWKLEFS
jgi:hypothetical protein